MLVTYRALGTNGRLGNQMFQIASTIGIAIKNNCDYVLPYWEYSKYFSRKLNFGNTNFDTQFEIMEDYDYVYKDITIKGNTNLVGYFQSYKYFEHCKDLITQYFLSYYTDSIGFPCINTCAVHVRRGDYLNIQHIHPVQSLEYYHKAMSLFPINTLFYIFSDDYYWCKDNFDGDNLIVIPTNTDIFDMMTMAKFPNQIISNSTYSWWSAYLNSYSEKMIIYPKNWSKTQKNISDLIPENWEGIDV